MFSSNQQGLRGTARVVSRSRLRKGSALLSVLWLSAALSVIAFTVATSVRGETERTTTEIDALRCYYLASAGIDRALLHIEWGGDFFKPPMPVMRFEFASGETVVEIIPENSKLDINHAPAIDIAHTIQAVGAAPELANLITQAVIDWRTPAAGGSFTEFDQYYLSLKPSFRARHASLQEIEELLLVRGMTPDLFYGRYQNDSQGRLVPAAGLRDCFSVYGGQNGFDVNTVSPALLRGLGISQTTAAAIVAYRRAQTIKSLEQIAELNDGSPGFARLSLGVSEVCTIRATARLRMANGSYSDVQRSVSALVGFLKENNPPFQFLRWYDNAWSAE